MSVSNYKIIDFSALNSVIHFREGKLDKNWRLDDRDRSPELEKNRKKSFGKKCGKI